MRRASHLQGSSLLAATFTIAIGAVLIGAFYQMLVPRFRSVHQSAAWNDALRGAEAGANHAVRALNRFAETDVNADQYAWTANGWTSSDPNYVRNGERTLAVEALPVIGGHSRVAVSRLAVDVYTRGTTGRNPPWFRIRSTARAELPDRFTGADKRDMQLRRMNLGARKNGVSTPFVARTVEVVVQPRFRFMNAISTQLDLILGNSSAWIVDSFDSTQSDKSDPGTIAGGLYPVSVTKQQSNGNIGSMMAPPTGTPYTPLVRINGATVKGEVWTNGGDDPTTTVHENVSNSSNVDQSRIFDRFSRDFPLVSKPAWESPSAAPFGNTGFLTGTQETPKRYIINGGLGGFTVAAPPLGSVGFIEILVNGDLNTLLSTRKEITIPPNVYATIYVDGNIKLSNGLINSNVQSSQVAARLTLYGVSTAASPTYTAEGNAVQILSFYGPRYNVQLDGTVTTVGAMVSRSFLINGGGTGGFHYDESLGRGGDIEGWEVVSYFDDSRAEL